MKFLIKPLSAEQIQTFIEWEYSGPYAMYNMSPENEDETTSFFLDPENGYYAIVDTVDNLLGFCNFGADARVPGGDYSLEAVDIGMGMQPDLTGQGMGAHYAAAVFDFAKSRYPGQQQRVTIAEFNKRAQQLCKRFGFVQIARFTGEKDGRPFVIMVRELIG